MKTAVKGKTKQTQEVFQALLAKYNFSHCRLPGVSAAAANRLFHGVGHPSADNIKLIASKFSRKDGALLVKAWIEEHAALFPGLKISVTAA